MNNHSIIKKKDNTLNIDCSTYDDFKNFCLSALI